MQRTTPTLFTEFSLFIIFDMETYPLYHFKTSADIFTKIWYIYKVLLVDGQRIKAHNFTLIFDKRNEWRGGGLRETSVFVSPLKQKRDICIAFPASSLA